MRIRYYDWLEAVAVFLVCSVHQVWLRGTVGASISMSIVPMAVPLFFMVHGALLLSKEASAKKQIKRFARVLVQLYFWNTVYLVVSVLSGLTGIEEITPGFLFHYYFSKWDSSGITSGHLWFIYALLVVYCLYPVLDICRKHNEKVLKYIAVVCFIWSFVRSQFLVYLNFFCEQVFGKSLLTEWVVSEIGCYFNSVCYFILGYYLVQWINSCAYLKQNKRMSMLYAVLGVLAGIALLMLERYVVFGTVKYNWKPLPDQYQKFGTLILAVSTFVLFSLIDFPDNRAYAVAKTISLHSLDIYYIHVIYAKLFRVYLYSYDLSGVWQNYLRAAVVLILSFLTGQILRRIPGVKRLL